MKKNIKILICEEVYNYEHNRVDTTKLIEYRVEATSGKQLHRAYISFLKALQEEEKGK